MRSGKCGWFKGCAVSSRLVASVWCDNCSDSHGQGETGPAGNQDVWLTLETVAAPAPSQAETQPWRNRCRLCGPPRGGLKRKHMGSLCSSFCDFIAAVNCSLEILPLCLEVNRFPRRFILKSSVKNVRRVIYTPVCQHSPRDGVLPLTQ